MKGAMGKGVQTRGLWTKTKDNKARWCSEARQPERRMFDQSPRGFFGALKKITVFKGGWCPNMELVENIDSNPTYYKELVCIF
jgi:hypothetical protein